jgi:L-Ala-D/L-Glu epimerase
VSVKSIDMYHVEVPLKKPIRHASHSRESSDNLVVRVRLAGGETGFGEGVPRSYVTGETIESTFATIAAFDAGRVIGDPCDYPSLFARLWEWTPAETANDVRGMAGNSARCALELALLDAYGRRFGRCLGDVVPWAWDQLELPICPRFSRPQRVRYSGAITADSERKERISAWKMKLYGFSQVKVKVGVAGQDDPHRLAELRRILGPKVDIRIDANEAWSAPELLDRVRPLLPFGATALEQPVPHYQVDSLKELRPKLGIPVMLDESLCGYPDARRAIDLGLADMLNVRLSKCGGILPSLRIAALAQRAGLGVQLGCHPGETGLLSAAGRHVATRLDLFRYVEGSYDRHVLKRNLTAGDFTFGFGGWARPIDGPGLGAGVDPAALERLTVARREIRYD